MPASSRGDWVRFTVLLLLCLLGLPILGGLGSWAYLSALQSGVLSRWQRLEGLPEPAQEIAGGDLDALYVRTAGGQLLGCDHQRTESGPQCWTLVDALPNFDQDLLVDEPVFDVQTPPPGPVRDSLTASMDYADAAFETRYVLLEDGTVWKAELSTAAYVSLGILCLGPLLGLGLGLVGAVAVALVWGRRALRR